MTQFISTLVGIFQSSGFARFGEPGGYLYAIMICVGCFLLYLAIVKEFEPLILLPMAFGMILANLPGSGIIHMQYFVGDGLEHPMWIEILNNGGLADMLYMGVKLGIYPPLIFLGIGTMTDFAPLISNPKSLLLGAAAQFGIFGTYMGARLLTATGLVDFTQKQSAAIAIIGGADGPTAIFVTSRLAPELLGSIAKYHNDVDGIILLTAFPCGPDSMINEMIIRRIKDRPILNLLLDSQDGNAGIETRLESFIDIIRFRKEARL